MLARSGEALTASTSASSPGPAGASSRPSAATSCARPQLGSNSDVSTRRTRAWGRGKRR